MKVVRPDGNVVHLCSEGIELYFENKWSNNGQGYLVRNRKGKMERFHRILMDAPLGMVVDHINRNTFDNRKANLRITTQKVNSRNNGAKGISWDKRNKKWRSSIMVDGKSINLGRYCNEADAILAYKEARKLYFETA